MENNSQLQVRLRKNQNTLVAIGWGVIAFGIWSVIKGVLGAALNTENMTELSRQGTPALAAFWVMLGIALLIDLLLRMYVGRSAIREGKGEKKRWGYIVFALLMALTSTALTAVSVYFVARNGTESVVQLAATMIVELTSVITLLELVFSAVKVRRLSRELKEAEG